MSYGIRRGHDYFVFVVCRLNCICFLQRIPGNCGLLADGWVLARFRACLLFACLHTIECMFVRASLLIIVRKYLLGFGLFFCVFCFVFS